MNREVKFLKHAKAFYDFFQCFHNKFYASDCIFREKAPQLAENSN